jgi:hypothetical protein
MVGELSSWIRECLVSWRRTGARGGSARRGRMPAALAGRAAGGRGAGALETVEKVLIRRVAGACVTDEDRAQDLRDTSPSVGGADTVDRAGD